MNAYLLRTLVLNEVRLRLRRLSSLVTVLVIIILSWLMIPDPQSSMTLIAVKEAQVLYTSSSLALGSASLASFLFGIAGFYLVRGRIAEDLRSGTGSVIAATPVRNAWFLLGRWLGSVLYLICLLASFLAAMLVYHLLRGQGPIELSVYLLTYAALFLPMALFTSSCAILFDSFSPLMGKLGDVIYFFTWIAEVSLMAHLDDSSVGRNDLFLILDFIGTTMSMVVLKMQIDTNSLSLGMASFDPKLPGIVLPSLLWTGQLLLLRALTALLAMLPLLPAILLFHRFSPDRAKMTRARKRRSPLGYLNQLFRPFSRLAQPLFGVAVTLPGLAGQILSELAVTVASTPLAGFSMLVLPVLSLLLPARALPGLLASAMALWGVLISEIACRDHLAASSEMTGVVNGGIAHRYLRQFSAAVLLGLWLTGLIGLRWSVDEPVRVLALLSGIASMSALATLLARFTGTSRSFLALFLFGMYVAMSAVKVSMIDVFGFNGVANMSSISTQAILAALLLTGGYLYNSHRLA